MFQLNDKIYRNLEEQVLQNKEDIAKHWKVDRVLADFGISILGIRATAGQVELITAENYGDAYLVGTEPPYDVYIWSRPDPDTGHDTAYWINIGSLSIEGGPGPAGKSISNAGLNNNNELILLFSDGSTLTIAGSLKGDKGDNGKTPRITATQTTTGITLSTYDGNDNLTGTYTLTNGRDGQDGESIQGPQGEPGRSLNILGTFASTAQFPTASTAEMGDACILQTGGTTTLYILTGTPGTPSTYSWDETSFGGGTEITVNGAVQSTWNADTKLNKLTMNKRIYATGSTGNQTSWPYSATNTGAGNVVVLTASHGQIEVPTTPTGNNHATSKQYVDNKITAVNNSISGLDNRIMALEGGGGGGGSDWNTYTTSGAMRNDTLEIFSPTVESDEIYLISANFSDASASYDKNAYVGPFVFNPKFVGQSFNVPSYGIASITEVQVKYNSDFSSTPTLQIVAPDGDNWNVVVKYKQI